jgi:NAD(P) transhydrogenase
MGPDTGLVKMILSSKSAACWRSHRRGRRNWKHIGQAVLNLKGIVEYFAENTSNGPTLAEARKIAGLDALDRICDIKSER